MGSTAALSTLKRCLKVEEGTRALGANPLESRTSIAKNSNKIDNLMKNHY